MSTEARLIGIEELVRHAHERGLRWRRIHIDDEVDAYAFTGHVTEQGARFRICTIVVLGRNENGLQLVAASGTEVAVLEGRLAG